MIIDEKPYFLTNEAWFYYDEEEFIYKLTKEATEEAKISYKEFYETLTENIIN